MDATLKYSIDRMPRVKVPQNKSPITKKRNKFAITVVLVEVPLFNKKIVGKERKTNKNLTNPVPLLPSECIEMMKLA